MVSHPPLDDYSRFILYAALVKKETPWAHILALQSVILKYGLPYCYYVDFAFPLSIQWKQVPEDCQGKVTMPCLPKPKGKWNAPPAGSKTVGVKEN